VCPVQLILDNFFLYHFGIKKYQTALHTPSTSLSRVALSLLLQTLEKLHKISEHCCPQYCCVLKEKQTGSGIGEHDEPNYSCPGFTELEQIVASSHFMKFI